MSTSPLRLDLASFRTFMGLSAIGCLAFLALFLSLFTAGAVTSGVVAMVTVLLSLGSFGFARVWYELYRN